MVRALRALAVTALTLMATFGTVTVGRASADTAASDIAAVPEPSALILLATGGAGLAWWLRSRRK